ncbi:hypothetical protein [Flavobacterium sp. AJR]|uniref:hypothetical protein n=1 Tax=Flavobacterium sp. AJR TaxID=1979369 RepID=UPI000A3D6FED|nr:hypothetical protein [Flavobacterium sp. AJR]OUL60043.1 hypothetical protein B8T70_22435 [Flavobacterium sp. AJR]
MSRYILLLIYITLLSGCKSNPINQKIDKKKEGVWIDIYTQDSVTYKSFEYYRKDEPVKKWKSYVNNTLYKTEKYQGNSCKVKYYYPNGKLQSKGKTKLEKNQEQIHWFYYNDWKYYDTAGKLIEIKKYSNRKLTSTTKNK